MYKENHLQNFECFFKGTHKDNLFYQFFPAHTEEALGSLILTHGNGEHIGVYSPLIHFLQHRGWSVYAWDLRGHGQSSGKRGYTPHFEDYIKDFTLFLREISEEKPHKTHKNKRKEKSSHKSSLSSSNSLEKDSPESKKPRICFAHSMGALIQSKAFLNDPKLAKEAGICGQVLSCPCFGLKLNVPKWKIYLGEVTDRVYPQMTMNNGITDDQLLKEPRTDKDMFRHHRTSFCVYKGMIDSINWLAKRGSKGVQIPTLMQLAGKEMICDNAKAKAFFHQIQLTRKILKIYSKSRHEIYGDLEKETVYKDLYVFLKEF